MLNRRTLRVKAMQALFAYSQSKEANLNVAVKQIEESFQPDLNSMEEQNPELLKEQQTEAISLWKQHYKSATSIKEKDVSDPRVGQVVNDVIDAYHRQVAKDTEVIQRNMVASAEKIYSHFLKILNLLIEFGRLSSLGVGNKKSEEGKQKNFTNNRILRALQTSATLKAASKDSATLWSSESDLIRDWFRDIISRDAEYMTYIGHEETNMELDYEILNHIVRKVIFKNETITSYWEDNDINWVEDHAIVRSMVNKTLKSSQTDDEEIELAELSYNWEDDKEFFENVYEETVKNEDFLQELVSEKTKNWEFDRIAFTDRLILMMAICEMMNFASIPVKVTINEYIEVSKNYSTPKSKQFVNGVLDVIAVDLQARGLIKKSGRGLIDNK